MTSNDASVEDAERAACVERSLSHGSSPRVAAYMVAAAFLATAAVLRGPEVGLMQTVVRQISLDGGNDSSVGSFAVLFNLVFLLLETILVSTCFVVIRSLWRGRNAALVSLRGRLSRKDFGLRWFLPISLFCVLFAGALGLCSLSEQPIAMSAATNSVIPFLFLGLLLFWPTLTVHARRLHDCDMSAWWLFLLALPIANVVLQVVLLILPGTGHRNKFGERPEA